MKEEWRVDQRLTVLQDLLVCFIEVAVSALVFPREETFLPGIGPSTSTLLLGCTCFVSERGASHIGISRGRVADEPTKVIKM